MIKVALKHWIYDYCINVAFDNIQRNFKKDIVFLKLDGFYKKIIFRSKYFYPADQIEFFNCKVTELSSDLITFSSIGTKEYKNGFLISEYFPSGGCSSKLPQNGIVEIL